MQLSEYMEKHYKKEEFAGYEILQRFPRIRCSDGFTISIQAGESMYCSPRDNSGEWYQFEAGFPSARPSSELMQYAENPDDPTETVYGYVPIEVLQRELDAHGGIVGCAKDFQD